MKYKSSIIFALAVSILLTASLAALPGENNSGEVGGGARPL